MLDLSRIVGFDWDDGNSRKSSEKHGIANSEAEQVFLNQPLIIAPDAAHSETEPRYNVIGTTHAGRLLQVTITLRLDQTLIRVISARSMSRKERLRYGRQ